MTKGESVYEQGGAALAVALVTLGCSAVCVLGTAGPCLSHLSVSSALPPAGGCMLTTSCCVLGAAGVSRWGEGRVVCMGLCTCTCPHTGLWVLAGSTGSKHRACCSPQALSVAVCLRGTSSIAASRAALPAVVVSHAFSRPAACTTLPSCVECRRAMGHAPCCCMRARLLACRSISHFCMSGFAVWAVSE